MCVPSEQSQKVSERSAKITNLFPVPFGLTPQNHGNPCQQPSRFCCVFALYSLAAATEYSFLVEQSHNFGAREANRVFPNRIILADLQSIFRRFETIL